MTEHFPLPAADLFLSAVTIGELHAGIARTREQAPEKAAELETWLDRIAEHYQVLPMDGPAFRCWARLVHRRSDDLIEDAMIAATAAVHRLTIVTRNTKDFSIFGIPTLNSFLA